MIAKFVLHCNNDQIWNLTELIHFLSSQQHQSIIIQLNPEAICLYNLGLYDILDAFEFKSVTIETFNPFEQHTLYQIKYLRSNVFIQEQPSIPAELHSWTGNKIFYACYGRPTAGRLGLASYLRANYKDISHLHFSVKPTLDNLPLFELNKLFTWSPIDAAQAASMTAEMPMTIATLDNYDKNRYNYADPLTQEYQQSLVDIVVEAHVIGNTFFPTEKTTRPMWLKKPFILFGTRNYLVYLRQMGFRTFSDFWDEDYDGYEAADRFKRIKTLIDTIASKPLNELMRMYDDMQYTLDHNYNLLMTQTYKKNITQL